MKSEEPFKYYFVVKHGSGQGHKRKGDQEPNDNSNRAGLTCQKDDRFANTPLIRAYGLVAYGLCLVTPGTAHHQTNTIPYGDLWSWQHHAVWVHLSNRAERLIKIETRIIAAKYRKLFKKTCSRVHET